MAKSKQSGKARQHSQRPGKRLGLKVGDGQTIQPGNILVRQRGTKIHPGDGTKIGKDFTIFATREGKVSFKQKLGRKYITVISQ